MQFTSATKYHARRRSQKAAPAHVCQSEAKDNQRPTFPRKRKSASPLALVVYPGPQQGPSRHGAYFRLYLLVTTPSAQLNDINNISRPLSSQPALACTTPRHCTRQRNGSHNFSAAPASQRRYHHRCMPPSRSARYPALRCARHVASAPCARRRPRQTCRWGPLPPPPPLVPLPLWLCQRRRRSAPAAAPAPTSAHAQVRGLCPH